MVIDKQMMNAKSLQKPRLNMFKELLKLCVRYKHVNQWK